MINFLLPATLLGGSRQLRATALLFMAVSMIAALFFYIVRVVASIVWLALRALAGQRFF
jgi:hypothetical protein